MAKSPSDMRASERIEEIASILAEGLLRLKRKKTIKDNRLREISLDSSAHQSVHAPEPKKRGKTHER
jgi:hypothetical protein